MIIEVSKTKITDILTSISVSKVLIPVVIYIFSVLAFNHIPAYFYALRYGIRTPFDGVISADITFLLTVIICIVVFIPYLLFIHMINSYLSDYIKLFKGVISGQYKKIPFISVSIFYISVIAFGVYAIESTINIYAKQNSDIYITLLYIILFFTIIISILLNINISTLAKTMLISIILAAIPNIAIITNSELYEKILRMTSLGGGIAVSIEQTTTNKKIHIETKGALLSRTQDFVYVYVKESKEIKEIPVSMIDRITYHDIETGSDNMPKRRSLIGEFSLEKAK